MTYTTRTCCVRHFFAVSLQRRQFRQYTLALARQVPPNIAHGLALDPASSAVSYERAQEQHGRYIKVLRSILPTLELNYLSSHPDCVFVEDTMVSIGKTAVMARPGHSSRQGEVASMRDVALQLGMNVIDMDDPEATLDGGDCLFTGRHLYVGISQRTNEKGFRELEKVYKDFTRVLPVPLPLSCASLHLKSVVTHLDEETLLAPIGKEEVLGNMLDSGGYETLLVPHPSASNVVVVNGHVLAQDVNCEESRDIIARACQERSFRLHWMDTSEFAKIDGALTCCSILLDI